MNYLDLTPDLVDSIPLVLYHKDCVDGFGAAYAIWTRYPHSEFLALNYGDPVPSVVGRLVFIVDFSLPAEAMLQLVEHAKHTVWLDHHKGVRPILTALTRRRSLNGLWSANLDRLKSGAQLAWEYIWPDVEPPPLLDSIADYDLWKFKLRDTEANIAVLCSYEYDFNVWSDLMQTSREPLHWYTQRQIGYALLRQHNKNALEVIRQQRGLYIQIDDRVVPAINCPRHLTGAVSKIMLANNPIVAIYYDTAKGRKWSLRSNKGYDVDKIARSISKDGGGHAGAAGFVQPEPPFIANFRSTN